MKKYLSIITALLVLWSAALLPVSAAENQAFINGWYQDEDLGLNIICSIPDISGENADDVTISVTVAGSTVDVTGTSTMGEASTAKTFCFLVDITESMSDSLDTAQEIILAVADGLEDGDNVVIMRFNSDGVSRSDFLTDSESIKDKIGEMILETGSNGDGTLSTESEDADLYGAVAESAGFLQKASGVNAMAVLVVISDGTGISGVTTQDVAVSSVEDADIPVFAVVPDLDTEDEEAASGAGILEELAEASIGGEYIPQEAENVISSSKTSSKTGEEIGKEILETVNETLVISVSLEDVEENSVSQEGAAANDSCEVIVSYIDEDGESCEDSVVVEALNFPVSSITGGDDSADSPSSEDENNTSGNSEDSNEGNAITVPTSSDEDSTEDPTDSETDDSGISMPIVALVIVLLLAVVLAAAYVIFRKKNQGKQEKEAADSALKAADNWSGAADAAGTGAGGRKVSDYPVSMTGSSSADSRVGKVHNIGRRRNQQDTLGVGMTPMGLLAVVSDGMGGLADGEKVSQTAVKAMLQSAQTAAPASLENPLYELLARANRQVLNMLGPDQIYKSGATLLAVLVANGSFHWVTVGDSRIYFYDGSHLLQMNSEHVFKRELIVQAVNGKLDFSRIESNTQKGGLVSFLGMGDLKYVEGSLTPVKLAKGDRILLMSDGIFNTISEEQILAILKRSKTAAEAAADMEKSVLDAANPKQDNFTCVILDI